MRRLRIAFDARMPPRPSGVGIYTSELLAALAKRRDLEILAVASPTQPLPKGVDRIATRVAFDAHGPAEIFEHVTLPQILEERAVDLLHGPNTIVPAGRTAFARVATIHDVAYHRYGETLTPAFRLLMRVRTRAALALSDLALTVSRFTAEELAELYPELAHKVRPVPSGTPEAARRHQVEEKRAGRLVGGLGLTPRRYLCAVGTLEPRKNLVTLLEAFARAAIPGVRLALVGDRGWRDGPLRRALEAMAPDSVVLTGWLDGPQVRDLLGLSAGLVYPSLYEGFGLPPLEALALGVPAACADIPPVVESCGDRVLRVAPLDVEGWSAALRELAESGPVEPWVGRTFEQVAEDTCELYRQAFERFRRR